MLHQLGYGLCGRMVVDHSMGNYCMKLLSVLDHMICLMMRRVSVAKVNEVVVHRGRRQG